MMDSNNSPMTKETWPHPIHNWLKRQEIVIAAKTDDPVILNFLDGLSREFERSGHGVSRKPGPASRVLFTSSEFGVPVNWRDAPMFTARRKLKLLSTPTIFTVLHTTAEGLAQTLERFEHILSKTPPDPADFDFPGLSPRAYRTLHEQGTRGGPIMALARLIQSQAKSIRNILLVGDDEPEYAILFDLVGAHPTIPADDPAYFYRDITLRLVTTMSTHEITNHSLVDPPLSKDRWKRLSTPAAMQDAAVELGKRRFFTEMVLIANLVHVPSISSSVASQYSEGCFATWEPEIDALVATVTGSARPVEKDAITDDDLALIVGVRDDGSGAEVRHVLGKRNDPPSSESVEMMEMDLVLPRITLGSAWGIDNPVPVVRSKLHGHRGVSGFDPATIEFIPLDPAYYHYPVSCATAAQAEAIVRAFGRSKALTKPEDPRRAVFTILPGHGLVMAEKWVLGKKPFQWLYEAMDSGALQISNQIPQGEVVYRKMPDGMMHLLP